jgi:hypothetical protein
VLAPAAGTFATAVVANASCAGRPAGTSSADRLGFFEPVGIRQPSLLEGDAAGLDAAVGVAAASDGGGRCGPRQTWWDPCRRGQDRRSPLSRHSATNHDPAQEDHDGHHGGRHEQEHELFPVQLDLVKSFI